MILEPRMLSAPPAQVLLHDAMHHRLVGALELERHRERDVPALVEGARIVAELHVLLVHGPAITLLHQQLGRFEDFGDEHGALTLRCGRKEVQVLPHRTSYGARDSDIMLKSG